MENVLTIKGGGIKWKANLLGCQGQNHEQIVSRMGEVSNTSRGGYAMMEATVGIASWFDRSVRLI